MNASSTMTVEADATLDERALSFKIEGAATLRGSRVLVRQALSNLVSNAIRHADPRLGHFMESYSNLGDDLKANPRVHMVARWRLEKKDPNAALSEPVRPITYWIDRNVPLKYRSVISEGILEWNTAFERIGYRNAIEVRIQPDDASFDTLDTGMASVRWMLSAQPGLAGIGPTHVDPRSGEILDADIAFEGNSLRFQRLLRRQILAEGGQTDWPAVLQVGAVESAGPLAPAAALRAALARPELHCEAAEQGAVQLGYALEHLAAQEGDDDGDSAAAEALVRSYLKNLVMHEVGHTLGLRHNFRASQVVDPARLADPVWSRENPLTGSVMDYVSANLPAPGAPAPAAYQQQLGPYDFWAIDYAYRPLDPADERTELARIAARSAEPELAFGTDEDAALGLDPQVLQFDLGSDPLAHVAKRLAIARDLIARAERQTLAEGDEYARLRRRVSFALLDIGGATGIALRAAGLPTDAAMLAHRRIQRVDRRTRHPEGLRRAFLLHHQHGGHRGLHLCHCIAPGVVETTGADGVEAGPPTEAQDGHSGHSGAEWVGRQDALQGDARWACAPPRMVDATSGCVAEP